MGGSKDLLVWLRWTESVGTQREHEGNTNGTGWERGVFTRGAGGQPLGKEEGLAGPASSRSLVDTPRKQQQQQQQQESVEEKKRGNRYGRTQHPIASPRLAIAPAVASGRDRSGHQPYPTLAWPSTSQHKTDRARQGRNAGAAGARGGAGAQRRNGFLGHSAEVQGLR